MGFINNFKVGAKLNLLTVIIVCLLASMSVVSYFKLSSLKTNYEETNSLYHIQNLLVKSTEQGIQIMSSLRGLIINPDDAKAKENIIKSVPELDNILAQLKGTLGNLSQGYNKFEIEKNYVECKKEFESIVNKINSNQTFNDEDNLRATKNWKVLKDKLVEWQKINTEKTKKYNENFANMINEEIVYISVFSVIIILVSIILIKIISNAILSQLHTFKDGLINFFRYINRDTQDVSVIPIDSQDEFGEMSKVINENILKTKRGVDEDRALINEAISVLTEFEKGDLHQRLSISVSNPALMHLKDILNKMATNLENNIDNVLKVLEQYSNYNYLSTVDKKGLKAHLEKLANGVNSLGEAITNMLIENKKNGLILESDSARLAKNVENLKTSANQQAASLEETAASLEEMTSNIQSSSHKAQEMKEKSLQTLKSVSAGKTLALKTASAMDDINNSTSAINEAITIIDQIAFQTNILSLNAAVEAATAGEAGRGFAVVAGEVRNLANRSSDAANSIKNLVTQATTKTAEGKAISDDMIRGYEELSNVISDNTSLIENVANATREQLSGISQINNAISQLDSTTQENAKVANETNEIAIQTNEIANTVVKNANAKEFNGKNSIDISSYIKQTTSYTPQQKHTPHNNANAHNHSHNNWDSF